MEAVEAVSEAAKSADYDNNKWVQVVGIPFFSIFSRDTRAANAQWSEIMKRGVKNKRYI